MKYTFLQRAVIIFAAVISAAMPLMLNAPIIEATYLIVPTCDTAPCYNGGGIRAGVEAATLIEGVSTDDPREVILRAILLVLSYMALAAVIVIIIAGIWMILSFGDEGAVSKAKNIIFYALLGLLIIALAAAIVLFFIRALGAEGIFGPVPEIGGVGTRDLRGTILRIVFYVLSFLALAAFVVIVIAGIWMVLSLGDETAVSKAKNIIFYAVLGLIIVALAAAIVAFIIRATGTTNLFGPIPSLGAGSTNLRSRILRALLYILSFLGLAAVLVIVIAGIWLVLSFGDEGALDRAKRIIFYAILGLVIVALAAAIVMFIAQATGTKGVFGPIPRLGGSGAAGTGNIRAALLSILDTVLSFMALLAVIAIVVAGIWLVVSFGNETARDRAGRIIFYTILGLLLILFAQAIVSFVASLATT